ncbi:MAG: dephospho-CoA kinase [Pseudomonadota bacterium]|jgi:dephospho-CoA kinase
MTWLLGLTGGLAAGKTQVANEFAELGARIIDADIIAREVVAPGSAALAAIAEHFSDAMLLDDGSLNRTALRERIFAQPADKQWLENLLHPLIRQAIINQIQKPNPAPYAILVAPLLFENGLNQLTQRTLVVDASEEQQLKRAKARDGSGLSTLKAILAAQMPRQDRLAQAHERLDNSGPWPSTQKAIALLHQQYLQQAAEYDAHNPINPLPHL